MAVTVISGWSLPLTAIFTDAAGVVHPLAGPPVWAPATGTNPSVTSLTPDTTDGLTAVMVAGAPGDVVVSCTGEGDPTPGVDTIPLSLTVTVLAPEDTMGTLTAGTPVPPPAPPPTP